MINKETIQLVKDKFTRSGKMSAKKVKDYLTKYEPEFNKYLETSTYEDVTLLVEKLGVPPTKEIMNGISSIIVGGKIEGFLIHSIAQDKFWSHKYGIDITGGLNPEEKFKLFLDGKLDSKFYSYKLTEEQKNNKEDYRTIALENFRKNQEKIKIENEIRNSKNEDNNNNKIEEKPIKKAFAGDLLG